jgi:hypothetical protein
MLPSSFILCLVDNAISALTDGLLNLLVPIDERRKKEEGSDG